MSYDKYETSYGGWDGPRSTLRVVLQFRTDSSRSNDSQGYVQWRAYVEVSSGSAFGGTTVTRSWGDQIYLYGEGTYGDSGWVDYGLVSYGSSIYKSIEAYYVRYSGGTVKSSTGAYYSPYQYVWTPYAVKDLSLSVSDLTATLSWTNQAVAARPYSGIYVDRSTNGGDWSNIKTLDGSTTSMTDSISLNSNYKYRVRPYNSAANASNVETGLIYTTPQAPTSFTLTQKEKMQTVVAVKIVASPSASNAANKTEVQYRPSGGSWVNVGTYGYATPLEFEHDPGIGKYQYRARNFRQGGLYSSWKSSSEITVTTLDPPTSVTASLRVNAETGAIDNRTIDISWISPALKEDETRLGYKIYMRDVTFDGLTPSTSSSRTLLKTVNDDTEEQKEFSEEIILTSAQSMVGKCRVITIESYNSDGASAEGYSNYVYGTLSNPSSISVSKAAYVIAASSASPSTNRYPVEHMFEFEPQQEGDTQHVAGEDSTSVSIASEPLSIQNLVVRAYLRPKRGLPDMSDELGELDSGFISRSVNPSPRNVETIRVIVEEQESEEQAGMVDIVFPQAKNFIQTEEFATAYEIYIKKEEDESRRLVKTIQAGTSFDEEIDAYLVGMERSAVVDYDRPVQVDIVTVYAYSASERYVSSGTTRTYEYQALGLKAPQLLSFRQLSENGNIFRIFFKPAQDGYPVASEQEEGYLYTVYIDGVAAKNQSPNATKVITPSMIEPLSGNYYVDVAIMSPKAVSVRMTARDRRSVSQVSNSLKIRYTITGVNVFVYSCEDIEISDCIIENMSYPMKVYENSQVKISNSTLGKVGLGSHYDMDSTSAIFETYNTYE